MTKNRVFESGLARTARLLSSGHNIKVVFKPGQAETVGNVVTLPSLPDTADQALLDAMQGYLDQQAGHVLFSDQNRMKGLKNASKGDAKAAQLYEITRMVEDARVELEMEELFPGSELNLTNAHHWQYGKLRESWDQKDESGKDKLSKLKKVLYSSFLELRHKDTDFYNNFIDQETRDKASQALEVIRENFPSNTSESVNLASKLLEFLEEEAQEDLSNRPDGDQSGGGDGQSPSTGSGEGTNPSDLASMLSNEAEAEKAKAVAGSNTGSGYSYTNSYDDYEHGLDDGQGYTIYSTEFDVLDSLPSGQGNELLLANLRDHAAPITSTMRTRLVNTLRATATRRWVGGRSEGRLDSRRAYKAVHGISTNVYKTRTKKVSLDTAIGLAIDHSGSMACGRLQLAGESAVVLGDVFHQLRIPFLVYGYSTCSSRTIPSNPRLYARWSHLWLAHYKDFDENWRQGALRLADAESNVRRNTLDGESVLYGVRRLLSRPEKRKVLLVFNDGAPYPGQGNVGRCQGYLKSVVDQGTKAGVEIIAFGIQSDEVKEYYKNYVVIRDLQDLVKEPLAKVDGILRKGMMKSLRG